MGAHSSFLRNEEHSSPPKDIRLRDGLKTATSVAKKPDAVTKTKLQVTHFQLPLHFEPSLGQTNEQVNFLSRGRGYTVFLTATEAVLALRQGSETSGQEPKKINSELGRLSILDSQPPIPAHQPSTVLHMQLVGANQNPHVAGQDELPGKINYSEFHLDET